MISLEVVTCTYYGTHHVKPLAEKDFKQNMT